MMMMYWPVVVSTDHLYLSWVIPWDLSTTHCPVAPDSGVHCWNHCHHLKRFSARWCQCPPLLRPVMSVEHVVTRAPGTDHDQSTEYHVLMLGSREVEVGHQICWSWAPCMRTFTNKLWPGHSLDQSPDPSQDPGETWDTDHDTDHWSPGQWCRSRDPGLMAEVRPSQDSWSHCSKLLVDTSSSPSSEVWVVCTSRVTTPATTRCWSPSQGNILLITMILINKTSGTLVLTTISWLIRLNCLQVFKCHPPCWHSQKLRIQLL